jgi:integrase
MLDAQYTIAVAERSGRASHEEDAKVARRRYQTGRLFVRGKKRKKWIARWREPMLSNDGNIREVQRSEVIGLVSELSKSKAQDLLNAKLRTINAGSHRPESTMLFKQFVEEVWRPGVLSMLKPNSSRYYGIQLDSHVLPAFGTRRLYEIIRADVQCFVAEKKRRGYSGSSIHGMRTALGKVLQSAVDWGYIEQNAARGINIGSREPKTERLYLSARESVKLIASLKEPVRTLVLVAVLTGLRIGELLALRWKHLDLLLGRIQVRETVSEGKFGTPKTKSSRRDVPISDPVREALLVQRARSRQTGPDDLIFTTLKQSPLNPKNLLRRQLRPACVALELPLVSWHSFRHTHATLLGEVGESLKTAQALLGHSDLETTLNVYTHAIPESQKRAVDKVANILFPNVPNSSGSLERKDVN